MKKVQKILLLPGKGRCLETRLDYDSSGKNDTDRILKALVT